jgi:chromosome segregation ATPase
MELTAITLSTLSFLAAIALGYAILRARASIRTLREGLTRSLGRNNELAKRIKSLDGRVQTIDQSLSSVTATIRRLANDQDRIIERLRTVEQDRTHLRRDLEQLTQVTNRISDDTETLTTRVRTVERDRTHLRRDLEELTQVTNRISDDTEILITWMRTVDARTNRSTALPSGPKPELQLKEEIDSITI